MRQQTKQVTWTFRILLLVAVGTVSWLTLSRPSAEVHGLVNDKVAHFGAFFALAAAFEAAFPHARITAKVIVLCGYGLLIECLQLMTGYRTFSWWDWLADISGVIAFLPFRPLFDRVFIALGLAQSSA